ncbi:MAG TPA: ABC transporter permease subunit [Methanomassiliicoccales archaeon]|nr:ABC transporter permease subunit [Methanomassiliicoccales archaeon]
MKMSTNLIGLRTVASFSARKLLMNRRWMLVMLLGGLVALVMGYAATEDGANMDFASDLMVILLLAFLLPVLSLIYGASMIRNEMDDRSIVQVITAPLDRRISYLGYYIGLAMVLCLLITVVTVIGGLAFLAFSPEREGGAQLMVTFIALQYLGVLVYSALFLLLGTLMRQPIYLGLIYIFVWEGFIGSVPGSIGDLTIRHQLQVIASELTEYGSVAWTSGDWAVSMAALVILTIVLVLAGAYVLRQEEVA